MASDQDIIDAAKTAPSMLEASKLVGIPYQTFRYRAKKLNVYIPNQGRRGFPLTNAERQAMYSWYIPTNEILEGKHPTYQTRHLKDRLLKDGILENKCSVCGLLPMWHNKPLVLHLDHINGVRDDHRLENLRIVCPNCHTQTDTYAGRNVKRG